MTDRILSHSSFSHIVDVPIERIDIADWLFNLPEAEYQRCCPPDHIAAGATSTDNGRRMSINVEMIGETLMIQHYIGEITEPHLCRMVSLSDAFTRERAHEGAGAVELSVKPINSTRCEYTNSVTATPTKEFLDFIKRHGISFEQAAAARQAAGGDHNRRETPLFAESIERHALNAGRHGSNMVRWKYGRRNGAG